VFILEDARTSTQAAAEPGKTYIVTGMDSGVNIKSNLNHKVTVVGNSEMIVAASPSGSSVTVAPSASSSSSSSSSSQARVEVEKSGDSVKVKVEEKDMPKLTARTVMSISDSCTPAE
jgi:hypothetical protein